MDGWIDPHRERWQNRAGYISELGHTKDGKLACPECRLDHFEVPLLELPHEPALYCERAHAFHISVLPGTGSLISGFDRRSR